MNRSDIAAAVKQVGQMKAVLLDVRTPEEYAGERAVGAICFELARLAKGEFPPVGKTDSIYVYCHSGARSAQAKSLLERGGYTDVRNLGGLSNWAAEGGVLESGSGVVHTKCEIEL